jgi:hypothetical protein
VLAKHSKSHRLQKARDEARAANRELAEGDYVPACVEVCPAGAMSFGDLEDPNSTVATLARGRRAFRPLEELGTQPKVIYLAQGEWSGGDGQGAHKVEDWTPLQPVVATRRLFSAYFLYPYPLRGLLRLPHDRGRAGVSGSVETLVSGSLGHLRKESSPNTGSSTWFEIAPCEGSCTHTIRSIWHSESSRRQGPCGTHSHAVPASV